MLGSKLLTVPAPDGKLTPDLIASRLAGRGNSHRAQPRAVEIAQATEVGTCYTLEELRAISEFCRANGLLLYVDGARLANAAAYLDCTLADLAAHADVLSFGGTKNGAMGAEAVIVMNEPLAAAMPFQRKQLMQLASKMRFLAAQFGALLDGELWRANAAHANAMARRLAESAAGVPGFRLAHPVRGERRVRRAVPRPGQDPAAGLELPRVGGGERRGKHRPLDDGVRHHSRRRGRLRRRDPGDRAAAEPAGGVASGWPSQRVALAAGGQASGRLAA